jgi:hypothetical protein
MRASTGLQHFFQRRRAAMLLEQIAEGFVGQVLKRLHAVERKLVQRVPCLMTGIQHTIVSAIPPVRACIEARPNLSIA